MTLTTATLTTATETRPAKTKVHIAQRAIRTSVFNTAYEEEPQQDVQSGLYELFMQLAIGPSPSDLLFRLYRHARFAVNKNRCHGKKIVNTYKTVPEMSIFCA